MRRKNTLKRSRVLPILFAGGIGYLLGGWHNAALRNTELSAAETVTLRFPEIWDRVPPASRAPNVAAAITSMIGDARLALLSPEPMIPRDSLPRASLPPAETDATPQADPQTAALAAAQGAAGSPPLPAAGAPVQAPLAAAAQPSGGPKLAAPAAHRRTVNRPGYMLNDAQIASIKERLNLTPDQARMWPAVEAALRNIAYARAQHELERGAPAGVTRTAAVDPDAVQGLKSAAVPLLMSFNAEQKEEVRNLAHVMGLDQLASQF